MPNSNGALSEAHHKRLPTAETFNKLLAAKQYDQVEQLLYEILLNAPATTPIQFTEILIAARQISLACSTCHDQVEWHKWASEEADHRENELRKILQVLSDLIHNPDDVPNLEEYSTHLTATTQVNDGLQLGKPTLWHRIQQMLGLESGLASPHVVAPVKLHFQPPTYADVQALNEAAVEIDEQPPRPTLNHKAKHSLIVYGLGPFRVYQDGEAIENWPSRKGKSVFRYLVLNRKKPIPKEVLMDCFWADADADAARNNLNVTIYNLRQTLRRSDSSFSHILFQDDCYSINPDFEFWVDFEMFTESFKQGEAFERKGDRVQAANHYRIAEPLYQGELFEEDRYDDWVIPYRGALRENYLTSLNSLSIFAFEEQNYTVCVGLCNKLVVMDASREDAHWRLMDCYVQMGQRYLALRQYHACVEALKRDLDIAPSLALTEYYKEIMSNIV